MTEEGAHKRVFHYDGAFRCLDCRAQWGALPGHPTEPLTCVPAMTASRQQVIDKLQDALRCAPDETYEVMVFIDRESIDCIIAALRPDAAERQEPVAWMRIVPWTGDTGEPSELDMQFCLPDELTDTTGWTALYPKLSGAADEKVG